MQEQIQEIERCAWCDSTKRLNYIVNGAWSIENLCEDCYQNMLDTSDTFEGIHNPCYPLYVRRNDEE